MLKSDHLLLPIKTNYSHNEGLCGNTGSLKVKLEFIKIQYPNYPHLLSYLIKARSETKNHFLEG